MLSIDVSQLKKRPLFDEKVRVVNGILPTGDYYTKTMVPIKIKHLFLTSLVLEGNRSERGTRNERDLEGHLRLHHHQLIKGQEKASDLKLRDEEGNSTFII